jgi:predicted ATPase
VLVRDVAYELLPRAKRQERHRATASFLEQMSGGVGEAGAAIARHLRDAGDHARAIDYFVAAAELAEHGWAKERAAALYREALQLAADSAPERQSELRRRVAIAETARFHVFDARMLGRRGDAGA